MFVDIVGVLVDVGVFVDVGGELIGVGVFVDVAEHGKDTRCKTRTIRANIFNSGQEFDFFLNLEKHQLRG